MSGLEMVSSSSSEEEANLSSSGSRRDRLPVAADKNVVDQGVHGVADGGTEHLLNDLKKFTGKHKEWRDFEWHEIVFVVLAAGSILVTAGLTIDRMVKTYDVKTEEAEFTFALLLLINTIFVLFYVLHGILYESFEELVAFSAGTIVVTLYVILDYGINSKNRTTLKLIRLILVCIFCPILLALGLYIGKNFRWLKFRVVGASESMQGMYTMYARFCSLLKFDLQLAVSLIILILRKGGDVGPLEISVLVAGLLFCVLWALMGFYAVRKENSTLVYIFYVLSLLEIGYIIFKCVNIANHWDDYKADKTEKLAFTLYGVAALAVVVRGILLFITEMVRRDFGHGLRQLLG